MVKVEKGPAVHGWVRTKRTAPVWKKNSFCHSRHDNCEDGQDDCLSPDDHRQCQHYLRIILKIIAKPDERRSTQPLLGQSSD